MIAFEIFVNGQKRLTAGGDEYQSFNSFLVLSRLPLPKPDDETISLGTSAMTPEQDSVRRVALWPTLNLAVGDRVEIRIVDIAAVDAPGFAETVEEGDENVDT